MATSIAMHRCGGDSFRTLESREKTDDDRWAQALDQSTSGNDEAAWIEDREGRVVASTKLCAEILGAPDQNGLEAIGKGISHFGDGLAAQTSQLILCEAVEQIEYRHVVQSPLLGTIVVSTTKLPLWNSQCEVIGVVGRSRPLAGGAQPIVGMDMETAHKKARAISELTAPEVRVLQLVCQGLSNKQIAAQLSAPVRTIENRRRRIMSRLNADSLADLVKAVIRLQDAQLIDLGV